MTDEILENRNRLDKIASEQIRDIKEQKASLDSSKRASLLRWISKEKLI